MLDSSLFQSFVLCFKIIFCTLLITKPRFNWWKTTIITIATFSVVFVAYYFVYINSSDFASRIIYTSVNMVVLLGFIILMSKRKWYSTLTITLNIAAYALIIGILSNGIKFATNMIWTYYLGNFVFTILLALYSKFLYQPIHDNVEIISKRGFIVLASTSLLAFFAVAFSSIKTLCFTHEYYITYIVALITFVAITIFQVGLYFIAKDYRKAIVNKHNVVMLQKQISAINLQNAILQENEHKLAIYRHDAKHYNRMLISMIENKQYDDAIKFINQSNNNLDSTKIEKYSNNLIINGVVCSYKTLAEKENIKFEACLPIPEKISINIFEIATFLCNCIENAINASLKLPSEQRSISMKSTIKENFMLFEIKNNFDPKIEIVTANLSNLKEKHGIGTHSINNFALSNDVTISTIKTDSQFTLNAIFPRKITD